MSGIREVAPRETNSAAEGERGTALRRIFKLNQFNFILRAGGPQVCRGASWCVCVEKELYWNLGKLKDLPPSLKYTGTT